MILNFDGMETEVADEESTLENILGDLFTDDEEPNEDNSADNDRTIGSTMNVNTAAESDILVQPRTIGATMNVYED
jgi:hypothetical protein